jgi:AraC-like DNA-binding protein
MKSLPLELGAFASMYDNAKSLRCVVKNRQHQYVYVNQGWLDSQRFESASEVLGKTALELFPPWRAERYMQEEREVMEGRKHFDYLESSLTASGEQERWRSFKDPWIQDGEVVGLTNVGVLIESRALQDERGDIMPHVIDWMTKHAAETISIEEIAQQCNMSRRSLERYFIETTGESPSRFRTLCRVKRAKKLLMDSEIGLAAIASACGFYDQSHLSRVFSKEEGVTPQKWREASEG